MRTVLGVATLTATAVRDRRTAASPGPVPFFSHGAFGERGGPVFVVQRALRIASMRVIGSR
jgi:hypothetical protein